MKRKALLEIEVLTLFPKIFKTYLRESIAKRAVEKKLVKVRLHQLRDFTLDPHKKCDDKPFGGGPGMVMTPEPIFRAVEHIRGKKKMRLYLLDPHGTPLTQKKARELSREKHWMLLCGHYEGIDERVKEKLVDEEISIGDFVTTGGEIPALAVIDAAIRLVPGVLGNEKSLYHESFEEGLLDHPHYTRPQDFRGLGVPEILVSGHHAKVEKWRREKRCEMTRKKRPDLLK
jgi:tRNA (guanine37-N1)-methyltransferase